MATHWQIGDRIQNRWKIHNILKGGMGIIYIVSDLEDLEAPAVHAAKTFQDEIFIGNAQTVNYFTQEALTWVNLEIHQNVAHARFVETIHGKPFLFLEYVSGGDLSSWIGTPRLTEDLPQVLRFAIQFCDGMIHAFSKGVQAHRDIKPPNCLVTQDGTLKVTDFGLARVIDTEGYSGRGGTPAYMPPEQWGNFNAIDMRADIYAFGVMLFQMVTGRLPFIGRTRQEFEHLHKSQAPPELNINNVELQEIVATCLAKNPPDRFAHFSTVRERLAEVYERLTHKPAPLSATGKELSAKQWNDKGVSLDYLGRHQEALVCYNRALKDEPRSTEILTNKGATLHGLGRDNAALLCYDHALTLNGVKPRVKLSH